VPHATHGRKASGEEAGPKSNSFPNKSERFKRALKLRHVRHRFWWALPNPSFVTVRQPEELGPQRQQNMVSDRLGLSTSPRPKTPQMAETLRLSNLPNPIRTAPVGLRLFSRKVDRTKGFLSCHS
jgi:hypothetical protein